MKCKKVARMRKQKHKIHENSQQNSQHSNYSDSEQNQKLTNKQTNDKGQQFWSLTKNKRISVGTFSGKTIINIRQFFQKDNKWLPTKKGITLNIDSWNTLKGIIGHIDKAIEEQEAKN